MTALSETSYDRPGWSGVPFVVQIVLEQRLDTQVANWISQTGGYTAALASRLELTDGGRVFVKGVPAGHPLRRSYLAEASAAAVLPENAPVPLLLGTVDDDWLLLVFEDVDGREPDLRPGSFDLGAVLDSLADLAATLTPCPLDQLPAVEQTLGRMLTGWSRTAARPPAHLDPWIWRNLDNLLAMESAWLPWAQGDTMLHTELRPDNMICRHDNGGVVVVDWAHPARGAAWIDLASLVPHLIIAGHDPAEADRLVLGGSAFDNVPAWAITGFAVALAGYWTAASRLAEPIGGLGFRAFQARAGAAALAWVAYRTRWS